MQTRAELEFMGRMLGLPPSILDMGEKPLLFVVARNMAMPEQNARAQQRIEALLFELPIAVDSDDEPATARRDSRAPRLIEPLHSGHSPLHFSRDN